MRTRRATEELCRGVFTGLRGWGYRVVLVDEAAFAEILARFNNALPILTPIPPFYQCFSHATRVYLQQMTFSRVVLLMPSAAGGKITRQ